MIFLSALGVAFAGSALAADVPKVEEERTAKAAKTLALLEYCGEDSWRDDRTRFLQAERNRGMNEEQMAFIATYLGALRSRDVGNLQKSDCSDENIAGAHGTMDELAR